MGSDASESEFIIDARYLLVTILAAQVLYLGIAPALHVCL